MSQPKHMEEVYQLEMIINDKNLAIFKLQKQLETLMQDYTTLKRYVENHDCKTLRKTNPDVKKRWQFYHRYKNAIKAESRLQNWREIKELCDQKYYQESPE
jgi:hypothetical protein